MCYIMPISHGVCNHRSQNPAPCSYQGSGKALEKQCAAAVGPEVSHEGDCLLCMNKAVGALHTDLANLQLTDRFDSDMRDETSSQPSFRMVDYHMNATPDTRSHLDTSASFSPRTSTPFSEPSSEDHPSEPFLPANPASPRRWSCPSPHSNMSSPREPFEYDNLPLPSIREDFEHPEVHNVHPLDLALYNAYLAYLRTHGTSHEKTRRFRGISKQTEKARPSRGMGIPKQASKTKAMNSR